MFAIIKKELSHYFNSPIAYIFIAIFFAVIGWIFWSSFFVIGQANMRGFFSVMPWMFLLLVPALTMRLWSEEKKIGSIDLLTSLPLSSCQLVLGKFLGAFSFLALCLFLTITTPLSVLQLGSMDKGEIIGGYIGSLLIGGAYISLGMYISAFTKNQIVAFLLAAVASFATMIIGADFVTIAAPQSIAPIMGFIGLGSHFDSVGRGVIDTRDLLYYCSFIFLFLWLNVNKLNVKQ